MAIDVFIIAFIGDPITFLWFASLVAGALAAATAFGPRALREAAILIALSWVISKIFFMNNRPDSWYFLVDFALLACFSRRLLIGKVYIVAPLVIIQLLFFILHLFGSHMNFSTTLFGETYSHGFIYDVVKNRLFELSLFWIIYISADRGLIRHVKARRLRVLRLLRSNSRLRMHSYTRGRQKDRIKIDRGEQGAGCLGHQQKTLFAR